MGSPQRKAGWFVPGGSAPGPRHVSPAGAALPGKPPKGNVGEWKSHSPRGPPGQGKQSPVNHAASATAASLWEKTLREAVNTRAR